VLGYTRIDNCVELMERVFLLKPFVALVWRTFGGEVRQLIERGNGSFPGIAINGALNRYIDRVMVTFFAHIHRPGMTPAQCDAVLDIVRLDVTSPLFLRYQLDAELQASVVGRATSLPGGGGGNKRAAIELTNTGVGVVDPSKKKVAKLASYCFPFLSTAGCSLGSLCRFQHGKPTDAQEVVKIKAAMAAKNLTVRPGAF
jgi:hypothetical protein